ncbi:MAG: NAD(P)/FAD-dependent oxidoreductase [Gemmataceae bacterium]
MTTKTDVSRRDALAILAGATAGVLIAGSEAHAEEKKMPPTKFDYDAVIVGGGPSGLTAALVLGRACRKVLVCDEGKPRNHTSPAVHGFFSRDGISPAELLKAGREQLKPYAVEWRDTGVTDAEKVDGGFRVEIRDGKAVTARKLILATGVTDERPDIDGLSALWGTGVLHCPYCHGWEVRNKPWGFIARGEQAVEWGVELREWTPTLTFCSNGPAGLTDAGRRTLKDRGVVVREEKIKRLDGEKGVLKAVVFDNGEKLELTALFVRTTMVQRSPLPKKLGCKLASIEGGFKDAVEADQFGATAVPGLYVVGDASRGMPQVATAVSDGSLAAIMANKAMIKEDAERA